MPLQLVCDVAHYCINNMQLQSADVTDAMSVVTAVFLLAAINDAVAITV